MADIKEILKDRILVLDGAMGTMIQRYNLTEDDFRKGWFEDHDSSLKGNNDLLSLTRPDIIQEIHEAYLEAGSDIIETNTFSGTSVAQADYNLEKAVYDINFHGAKVAKQACEKYNKLTPEKPRFVAGSIGPTNATLSISPDVNDPGFRGITFEKLCEAYKEQTKGLIEGGSDILLVETVFDTLNAKAALFAINDVQEELGTDIPVMVSGTITDASGRTLSGQTAEAFLISVEHANLLSIGLNCALGASALRPYLQVLRKNAPFYVSAHPNAGLPNEMGEYDETPAMMAKQIEEFLDEGLVNIVGGCCGTTPDHIKAMVELVEQKQLKKVS